MDSTHTFNTAHFTDNERTVIEVYWEKDGVIRTENIPAKAGDTRYKNLMTHLNIDQLHENTYKYIRVQDEAYQNDVIVAAKERGLIYDVNSINSNIYKALVETLLAPFDPVEDKEKLFMTKLQIFEVETIKSSTRKDLKSKLRKAKTVLDAFELAIQISKAVPAPVLAVKKKAPVVDIESTNLEMLSTDNADYIAPLEIQEDSAE
jgi:hypothetical protein|tara:strand:- start:97 stop:711 length:615 start_codon:yes stop_codon:yes gene_type:complete